MSIAGEPAAAAPRRVPLWLWSAFLLTTADLALDTAIPLWRTPGRKLFDFLVLEYICILGLWIFSRAGRRLDIPPGATRVLNWVRLVLLFQATGGIPLILMRMLPSPAAGACLLVSNTLFILSSGALVVGLVCMDRAPNETRSRPRLIVDALTFIVGIGVPFWLFSLKPSLGASGFLDDFFTVVFPLESFCGLLVLSWALETRAALPSRRGLRLLMVGAGFVWVTDIMFATGEASGIPRSLLIDAANLTTAFGLCVWLAAGWRFSVDPYNQNDRRPLVEFSPLPLITIVAEVGLVVLLVLFREPDEHLYVKLLGSIFLFLGILMAREFFVIRDSLRLVAVEAAQRSQARFEAMVRLSSDAVVVVDDRRVIRFASFAARGVLGITPDSMVGMDLLDLVHKEDREEAGAFFEKLVLKPNETGTVRWRMLSPDGTLRYLETAGSNFLSEPEIGGLVLNTRNVSERIQLEDQLHRVARMEAVGRLAGSVAHDFNNLLAVVLTNADLAIGELEDRGAGPSDPVRQDLDEIRRAAARGSTLTNRLLAFSRTEVVKPRAIPAAELIKDAVPMLLRTVGPTIHLETSVAPECGSLKVNPDDFIQALINLGSNARDAMPEGGTLTVSAAPARIEDRLPGSYLEVPPGPYICVSVSDTGEGMDEATRRRAFEPFFTTKERLKGTGLGLASVYTMVKGVKGGITLASSPGKGTTVRLLMPEVGAEPEAPVAPAPEAGSRRGQLILVVEDEVPLRNAMDRILRSAGYRVLLAGDADSAEKIFDTEHASIDLVLSDVIMPGRSGTRMVAEFRHKKPSQKVLLLSGFTGDQLGTEGLGNAGLRLLKKPYDTVQLLAAVRDVLDKDSR